MADKQKTIDIIFGGVDKTGSAIGSVGKNLSALENKAGAITGPLADITGSILKLDAALAVAAVGVVGFAIKTADEFDTAFREITTLIGQPSESLGQFKNDIQTFAESSTASFEEITEATFNAISSGVDYQDSLEVIRASEKLAIAGRADLGTTTRALVSTINAFGGSMDNAEKFADTFFVTAQKGQTTIPLLADSIGRVAPIAAQAGITFDELGAAIAAVTAGAGVNTTEAITALQATISNLIKPSKEASDLAAELGIEFNAAALESKGLAGVLNDVKDKTGGNVEQMAKLFGSVRSLTAVLPLTGSASKAFADDIEAMKNKTGLASNAAKELENDLGRLGQTLKNNVTSAFSSFGDNFTDESGEIIKSLTSIFNSTAQEIKLKDGSFAPLISQIEGVFQDISDKFEIVAKNFPEAFEKIDFNLLVKAFSGLSDELGESFAAIFGNVDLTTVEGLSDAIQTVIDAFTALVNISTGIINGLEPLFVLIGAGIETFKDLSEEEKKAAGEFLGLATALDALLPLLGGLGTVLSTVGGAMAVFSGAKMVGLTTSLVTLKKIALSVGKGGLIGAALFGGVEIGQAINRTIERFNSGKSLGSIIFDWVNGDDAVNQLDFLSKGLDKTANAVGKLKEAQNEANKTIKESTSFKKIDLLVQNDQITAYIDSAKAQGDLNKSLDESIIAQESNAGALKAVNEAITLGGDAIEKQSKSTIELAKNSKNLSVEYDNATGKINSWSGSLGKNSKALDSQVEKTKEALKQTVEYQTTLLELASDERIASIEAKVSLDIAGLEADTKKAVAVIESLGTSINSTGSLLGELFGSFNDASKFDKLSISKQIQTETENRKRLIDIQDKLAREQIDLIRAKVKAVSRGETLIKVSAEGLTGALEVIWNEVLKSSQIRASEEGLNLLLGI